MISLLAEVSHDEAKMRERRIAGNTMMLSVDCLRPKRKRVRSILRNPLLVSTLYSGTHILPQFSSGYLKKGRVHIIAKVMLYSGTVPGQQV